MKPKDPTTEVARFMRAARTAMGLTQDEFAQRFACTKGNVSGWENGRHEPNFNMLQQISIASGVDLPDKSGQLMSVHEGSDYKINNEEEGEGEGELKLPHRKQCGAVPKLNLIPLGDEQFDIDEEYYHGDPEGFDYEWCQSLGIDSHEMGWVIIEGDSMSPELDDGDSVLIDMTKSNIADGRVYLIRYGDEFRVKRLQKTLGGIRIINSNPDKTSYPDEIVKGEQLKHIEVIGRVVWRSGHM